MKGALLGVKLAETILGLTHWAHRYSPRHVLLSVCRCSASEHLLKKNKWLGEGVVHAPTDSSGGVLGVRGRLRSLKCHARRRCLTIEFHPVARKLLRSFHRNSMTAVVHCRDID